MSGRSPKGSGYSAEPEPEEVSAVPVSIPNAVLERMDEVLALAREVRHTPHSWWMSPPIYDLFEGPQGLRPLRHQGLPISVHDEWAWGWMLVTRGPHEFAIPKPFDASAIEAQRAGTPQSGPVHESSVGNAETPNPSLRTITSQGGTSQ
jgi:hypothetical protein